jgi:predicted DNA-binding antitoxin AbrB/MazE fold protein
VSEIIEVIYEDGVLKPLKIKIKIIDESAEEFLKSMIIKKCKDIDYKKSKEAYYESF